MTPEEIEKRLEGGGRITLPELMLVGDKWFRELREEAIARDPDVAKGTFCPFAEGHPGTPGRAGRNYSDAEMDKEK